MSKALERLSIDEIFEDLQRERVEKENLIRTIVDANPGLSTLAVSRLAKCSIWNVRKIRNTTGK